MTLAPTRLHQPEVMLDLETMSTRPGAAIVAIGAVAFDRGLGVLGSTFYEVIDLRSSARSGSIDAGTVLWWLERDDDARAELVRPDRVDLNHGLSLFERWLNQLGNPDEIPVWGNGADFDNVVLRTAYDRLNRMAPWHYRNNRCLRTLLAQHPDVPEPTDDGLVHHHALHDALRQAKHVLHIDAVTRGQA